MAPNTVNTWDLSANTLNGNVTHSGMTTLEGGSMADTFNINFSRTHDLKGGGGADNFVFSDAIVLTGSIDGGSGTERTLARLIESAPMSATWNSRAAPVPVHSARSILIAGLHPPRIPGRRGSVRRG